MVYTPGLLKWAMSGYQFKDKKSLIEVFKSYNLSDQCVHDLLSGKIPYEVIEETVVFEYDKSGYEAVIVNSN
jgi:hypothetical protein